MSDNSEKGLAYKLPWQDDQWQQFQHLIEVNKLPHAFIFSGPSGVGKHRFAYTIAQTLMCEQPLSTGPCGSCRHCQLNRAGTHPDLRLVTLEEKARQIKVEQIRAVEQFIQKTSMIGLQKVVIITPAHTMNINAANALLKSLEEPASNTLIILISNLSNQLLATLRSRCQIVNFPVPNTDIALSWLSAKIPDTDQAIAYLEDAEGRPLLAEEYLDSGLFSIRQDIKRDFNLMMSGKSSAVGTAAKWTEIELPIILSWIHLSLSRYIKRQMTMDKPASANPVPELSEVFTVLDSISLLATKVERGATPNKLLAIEGVLLDICAKFHI